MTQYILKSNGKVVPKRTVKQISPEVQFDNLIYAEMGDSLTTREIKKDNMDYTPYENNEETSHLFPEDKEIPFEFFNASLTDCLDRLEFHIKV